MAKHRLAIEPGKLDHISFTLNGAKSRWDTFESKKYLVVPMVMLTEGVHNGSLGAGLYGEDEISKTPEAWNHKPIVVYHPTINGTGVSACDPSILESRKIGLVFNTEFDGRLTAEAWIDPEKCKSVDDRILNSLEKGKIVELSTGLFMDREYAENGDWEGEKYDWIARNFRPDHLAILPDQKGACSIADGAGLGANAWTEEARKAAAEARAAKSGGAKGKLTGKKEEKGTTWSKTGKTGKDNASGEDAEEEEEFEWSGRNSTFKEKNTGARRWISKSGKITLDNDYSEQSLRVTNEASFDSIRTLLSKALKEEWGEKYYCYVVDVFSSYFIYDCMNEMYKQDYKATDTSASLVGEPVEVVRFVDYRAPEGSGSVAGINNKENNVTKAKLISQLIANSSDGFSEDDREFLMKKDEKQLKALLLFNAKHKDEEDDEEDEDEDMPMKGKKKKPAVNTKKGVLDPMPTTNSEKEPTFDEWLKTAPKKYQDVLQNSVRLHESEKKKLIEQITGNARNKFSAEKLGAMGIEDLQALAEIAAPIENSNGIPPMFAGLADAHSTTAGGKKIEGLPLPKMTFDKPSWVK